jgi:Holliday junction resolvase RusA-like endonuclease
MILYCFVLSSVIFWLVAIGTTFTDAYLIVERCTNPFNTERRSCSSKPIKIQPIKHSSTILLYSPKLNVQPTFVLFAKAIVDKSSTTKAKSTSNKVISPLIDMEDITSDNNNTQIITNTVSDTSRKTKKVSSSSSLSKSSVSKGKSKNTAESQPSHWVVSSDEITYESITIPIVPSKLTTKRNKRTTANTFNDTLNEISSTMSSSMMTNNTMTLPSLFRFTIRGNPLPLRRHRTRLGFIYNPSASTQKSFRTLVEEIIHTYILQQDKTLELTYDNDGSDKAVPANPSTQLHKMSIPLWDIEQPIAVSIVFRMKRPKSHFINNKPSLVETDTDISTTSNMKSRLRSTAPIQMCTSSMRTDVDNLAKFVLDSLNNITYVDDRQIVSLHVTKLYDNEYPFQGSTTVCIRLLQNQHIPHLLNSSLNMF